jgi:large-conductance mechanosensitive channel
MFEFLLGNSSIAIKQFQTQFKEFVIDNRLVGTAAGVTVGITTKDLIQSFVGDIVIPFFYLIIFQFGIEKIELLPGKTTFDYTSFFRQVITWILSVIAIFFFVYYFFMSVVGINQQNIKTGIISQPEQKNTPTPSIIQTNPITTTISPIKTNQTKTKETPTPTPFTSKTNNSYSSSYNSYNNTNDAI